MKNWFPLVVFLLGALASEDSFGSQIAYFYALDKDGTLFTKEAGPPLRTFSVRGTAIREFSFKGHTIFLVKMGSGCVNTALNAQALLATKPCDHVISTGPVGALDGSLDPGSWHLVEKVVPWQSGAQRGEIFAVAESMIVSGVDSERIDSSISVASGETFIASTEARDSLEQATGCQAVDMNMFGLISALKGFHGKQAHYRVISDRADDEAGKAFLEFTNAYSGEGVQHVFRWIESLPIDKTSPANHPALNSILRGQGAPSPQEQRDEPKTNVPEAP